MSALETATFDFGVVSHDRFSTYHYKQFGGTKPPAANQDYAHFTPEVGAFVADGVGGEEGGEDISKLAVISLEYWADKLGIRHMGADEAVDAAHDALHRADEFVGRYKASHPEVKAAATTLGGLLIARKHLIAIGIGDTPVFRHGAAAQQNGLRIPMLTQLTEEQGTENNIFNFIAGEGRPPYAPWSHEGVVDVVRAIPVEPGDRYAIISDGILGDKPDQRIPAGRLTTALIGSRFARGAADLLAFLPTRLLMEQEKVEVDGQMVPYRSKHDDASVATLFVRQPEK